MTTNKADGIAQQRLLQSKAEGAIALALKNKWREAVEANREILGIAPEDIDTLNRLARALLELAELDEARKVINKVVGLAPTNPIARRNAERLMRAGDRKERREPDTAPNTSVSLDLFVKEAGKSAATVLVEIGEPATLRQLSGGDPVNLVQDGKRLLVQSRHGEYIGRVQPQLAHRTLSLMDAGNRYAAAVLYASEQEVRVVIREVYQDSSQVGKLSFTAQKPDGFRSYARSDGKNVVYYDLEEPGADNLDDGDDVTATMEVKRPPQRAIEPSADDEDYSN